MHLSYDLPFFVDLNSTNKFLLTYVKDATMRFKKPHCELTGSKDNLVIHHIVDYDQLVLEAFQNVQVEYKEKVADLSKEDLKKVIIELIRLHTPEKMITVTKRIHCAYHDNYEVTNTETWEHFVAYQKKRRRFGYNVKSKNKSRKGA